MATKREASIVEPIVLDRLTQRSRWISASIREKEGERIDRWPRAKTVNRGEEGELYSFVNKG